MEKDQTQQQQQQQQQWPIINNKYIVHMKIATGQQGSVVLGTEKTTRERYAIKIYKKKQQKDYFERYVKLEMEKLKQSKSEYIIHLEEILVDAIYLKPDGTSTQINAIVMTYAPYGNFHDFIYLTGPFTEKVAKYYFRQLILGINYLHNEQNICHRDLKPDNMLLDSNLDMKICDLGMSACLSNKLTTSVGNLQFQAPEIHALVTKQQQSQQQQQVNEQPQQEINEQSEQDENNIIGYNGRTADIFSAGVILFLMLTGSYPFFNTKSYTDTTLDKVWSSYKFKTSRDNNNANNANGSNSNASNSNGQNNNNNQNDDVNNLKKSLNQQTPIFSSQAIDLITLMLQKEPLNRISLAEIIIHPWLASEQVEKKEITQFMQEKIQTYLKETRTEYRQKKTDELEKQSQSQPTTANRNSLVYNGFQKFRSDSSSVYEKQILVQEVLETMQIDNKIRLFKSYSDDEIGMHDYEFESKGDQNGQQEIKSIITYLLNDSSVHNVTLDDSYYKGMKSLGLNVYQKIKQLVQ